MKLKNIPFTVYQSSLGIFVEIAYSFALILMSFGVIYVVKLIQWFLSRP